MNRLIRLLLLSGLLLTACAGNQNAVKSESVQVALNLQKKALTQYNRGCDGAALDYFLHAHEMFSLIDRVNSVAICLNNIGNIYRRSGNIDDALLFFEEATALFLRTDDPVGAGRAMINKAAALTEDGRLVAAEKSLNGAVALVPPKSEAKALLLSQRAVVLMKKEDNASAETVLKQAVALATDPESSVYATINGGLGNLMIKLNRYEEAFVYFRKAYQADLSNDNIPAMADDLAALANVCLALEKFDDGLDYLKRSLKLYALTGRIPQAKNQFERLVQVATDNNRDITVISHFAAKWIQGEAILDFCR